MRKRINKIGGTVMIVFCIAIMLCPSAIAALQFEVTTTGDGVGVQNNEEILFDMGQNEIEILGAEVGIGETAPNFKLEVTGSSGSGYFGVTSSSDGDIFIIDSSGNVGIGVSGPLEKLEVNGNIALKCGATRSFYIATPAADTDGNDLIIHSGNAFDSGGGGNVGGDLYLRAGNGDCKVGFAGGHGGDVFIYGGAREGAEGVNGDVILAHTGSAAPGMVGIGTSTPRIKLDVLGTSGAQLRLTYTDNSVYTDFITTSEGYLSIGPTGWNVGIGTANPDHQLHILSTGYSDSMLKIDTYNAGYDSGIRLAEADTDKWFIVNDGSDSDKLKIASDGGLASETRFTIQQDGNFGIGTASLSSKLDVNGDIEIGSGDAFYFGDPDTNDSCRITRDGDDLVFERRESGSWNEKDRITAS